MNILVDGYFVLKKLKPFSRKKEGFLPPTDLQKLATTISRLKIIVYTVCTVISVHSAQLYTMTSFLLLY